MRVVVTGREGQVARSLAELGPELGHEVIALARPQLELSDAPMKIARVIAQARPDIIISAAAYTAVDRAESEPDLAFNVNARGAGAVADAARALGVPLLHLSTDYVFDGSKPTAYVEEDGTGPTGVYGRSKLAGEQLVLAAHDDVTILRTAWVYSPFGANFAKTMLRLASHAEEVRVVADQHGNPTSAFDIAQALLTIASNLLRSKNGKLRGLFHLAGTGDASWADFAEQVFASSAAVGGPIARVQRIGTDDYPTPAKRPSNSRLACERLGDAHGIFMPDWHQSTLQVVQRLVEQH